MGNFQINSERLLLRDLREDDLEAMCKLCLNPKITRYMDYIAKKDRDEVLKWIQEFIKHNNAVPRHSYNLVVVEKESGEMVGWIGIGKPDDKDKGDLDFGYAILEEHQGKGYGTEALNTLIEFCFGLAGVHKIFGECDKENVASQRIMQKCGMRCEREVKEDDGEITVQFSIVRKW